MTNTDAVHAWRDYCDHELALLAPILARDGYVLDDKQPHLGGERYLMQAVTGVSGRKVILLGRRTADGVRAVIKASSEPDGRQELAREHECRSILETIGFAYQTFSSPEEFVFKRDGNMTVSITRFVEQESTFLARPLREQFMLALTAFKAQESAHATTGEHFALIKKHFDTIDAAGYRTAFERYADALRARHPEDHTLAELLALSTSLVAESHADIERYCGFLTHIDFVPHNIRIAHGTIYLLDHSSLRFGNKYEGWARFLNFMLLYNPALEQALVEYVRLNRTPEESVVLRMMRIFRVGEILTYYTKTLDRSSGNLLALNTARLGFWRRALLSIAENSPLPDEARTSYVSIRDSLRSADEIERQKDLH